PPRAHPPFPYTTLFRSARPGNKLLRGSVGKPLPGVEVRIDSPDENGVGEVLARGQNVMVGYYNNDKATDAVLNDRWLKTGDLGRDRKSTRLNSSHVAIS